MDIVTQSHAVLQQIIETDIQRCRTIGEALKRIRITYPDDTEVIGSRKNEFTDNDGLMTTIDIDNGAS